MIALLCIIHYDSIPFYQNLAMVRWINLCFISVEWGCNLWIKSPKVMSTMLSGGNPSLTWESIIVQNCDVCPTKAASSSAWVLISSLFATSENSSEKKDYIDWTKFLIFFLRCSLFFFDNCVAQKLCKYTPHIQYSRFLGISNTGQETRANLNSLACLRDGAFCWLGVSDSMTAVFYLDLVKKKWSNYFLSSIFD